MDYVQLGRTGLKVSPLCLGTMNFGPHATEEDSFAIMDHALELGINFFDTANVYGRKMGEGITEQIVGRWFAQGGGQRGKVIMEQLDGSFRALKIKFSKKQLDELDKIFPGPGGEAPEAYAW